MNKNFIVTDKTNNLQKNATAIIKFNFENKDYLVYSIDENDVNKQIFVSKLIINSEGNLFIDNILPEEKNKLSNIVYNLVILTPSNFKKGASPVELIKDIKEKLMVTPSLEIKELGNQEYYANCSIAITNKEFVEDAIKFYNDNLNVEKTVEAPQTPTWTIPTEEPQLVNPSAKVVEPIPNAVNTPVMPNVQVPANEPIQASPIPNSEVAMPSPANIVMPNPAPVEMPSPVPSQEQVASPAVNQAPVSPVEQVNTIPDNLPNPQAEKLENIAVVSDPSLSASGLNVQPNLGKQKNAGFTLNKYVIIGTICILLAIAVVVVAYILIQKKINGA